MGAYLVKKQLKLAKQTTFHFFFLLLIPMSKQDTQLQTSALNCLEVVLPYAQILADMVFMASRKQKALSLEKTLDVLKAIGKQAARKRMDVAKDVGKPPSTLNSIISKCTEIEGNAAFFSLKAKQARGAKHKNLDEVLLT
ncbi:hypothetical protein HPB51_018436 [Rhipicephalus microplus]|uniref:Uncharacterized protein n=1 Tax=Rhipicephalus microplus TaxID=6941 RepID=A0A9J6EI83_RHIMP|nr:hypothetical protein HPB51_018436 [Rhipicephalus microplus]